MAASIMTRWFSLLGISAFAVVTWACEASAQTAAPVGGPSSSVSIGEPHAAQAIHTDRPSEIPSAQQHLLDQMLIQNSHAGPRTPVETGTPTRSVPAPSTVTAPPHAALTRGSPAAPTDFAVFQAHDFGPKSGLIPEPTEATNGQAVMVTWNTYAAVSGDRGATWKFVNPATTFPAAYGGLCCDQTVLYEPNFDLFIWVLQYFADPNNNNAIRIAVARGASNMLAGRWFWYDYTPQSVGAKNGSNWDQPKIATSSNYLFIESTSYGASGGSYLLRFPLEALAIGAGCGCRFIGPFVEFSPGLVQGAQQIMYFAAHRSTSQLRIFQWPDNSNNFFWNDINHTSYPQNLPYRCPRSGGNSTSDWCQRRSFGGGWAHTDRIFNIWLSNGTIGVAWDASQGASGFGTFAWPYVQVEIVKLTGLNGDGGARSPLSEPYLSGNGFAIQYSAFAANGLGGLGGAVEFGGGSSMIYESCSIVMWDQYQTRWALMLGYYGNVDPSDTLSGDYLSARGNGGNPRTWSATCYNLLKTNPTDTSTGNSHQLFLRFGRVQDKP
jgi:hypothetical protein